jgi:hypothetical protein
MTKFALVALLFPIALLIARQAYRLWIDVFDDPYGDREFRSALRRIEKEKKRMAPK